MLLVGFAGAFRRSELVALDYADLEFQRDGLVVTLRRSKTDPKGQGRRIGIPLGSGRTCPVRALEKWIETAAITTGPLFRPITRHGRIENHRYASHSLRAGLATCAARNGASERSIMKQTGHRSLHMVRRYIRDGEIFRDNAAAKSGI